MAIKIALAGNPNSGKTTLFNALTGSTQHVGNWPGVTVEKKEGRLKNDKDVIITDLPGIYSLSPYTPEEVVARRYILDEKPDVIINLVDATNIERNLYLTTQICELGVPVVIALNMIDIVQKNGDKINAKAIEEALGVEVVEISALKGTGCKELAERANTLARSGKGQPPKTEFFTNIKPALSSIESMLPESVPEINRRWYAVKLFERDQEALSKLSLSTSDTEKIEEIITDCEKELDDDSEGIATSERYAYITKLISGTVRKGTTGLTTSDKIDRVITNRWLALPIFALVMFVVYFVSVSWLGTIVTDWTNDVFVGEIVQGGVAALMENAGVNEVLTSLIVDGILGGVGAVLGFLPQMLILFIFLAILEDCGYMARIAFIMDRIFRRFGLSGKSFIPMLISTGCGVPGVMSSRTIENDKDRRMTVMTATFMPCGAKLPIIALISGAFFPDSFWVAPSVYFMGIGAVLVSGIILKKTQLFSSEPAPFVMELPAYHMPGVSSVLRSMWQRGKAFIIKAGTIIFISSAVIWFLSSFSFSMHFLDPLDIEDSILAIIGGFIAPIFTPLGFGDWQATVATITGLVAKENVVATFGIMRGIEEALEDDPGLLAGIATLFTPIASYAFMAFNMLCAPCFAAIGAIRREMASAKWTFAAIGYQTALAYMVALMIYQLGMLFSGNGFGVGTVFAFAVLIGGMILLFRPSSKKKRPENRQTAALHY